MNIAAAKEQIRDTVEAYLEKDETGLPALSPVHQRPIFLVGAPGIGKTAIMEQIAQELEIGIVSYSMAHHTRQSALGLPRIVEYEFEGFRYEASEYTMSEIISTIYDYMRKTNIKKGILFLDEINCVSETLYPSMLQFLQFKMFGRHRVPNDWVIVCAGNPSEYNRSVHEFDIVTLDRLRQIDVEPDYDAWKQYATTKGIHPAVTTFLESKRDCFYKVEAKPGGGKIFVTARGWEDLAEAINLYEKMGKPVNHDLIMQFLHDEEIVDQFAVYYLLFNKYRSDYQVVDILAGNVASDIGKRAHDAEFDERIALLSLILDALGLSCNEALAQESLAKELRDILRDVKPVLLEGAQAQGVLDEARLAHEQLLSQHIQAGTISRAALQRGRRSQQLLKDFSAQCVLEDTPCGLEAFQTIEKAYMAEVEKVTSLVKEANLKLDNAFTFIERYFSRREMLVFIAELTTRKSTTRFIAHYGNESYYAHNDELQVDAARIGISERISELKDMNSRLEKHKTGPSSLSLS